MTKEPEDKAYPLLRDAVDRMLVKDPFFGHLADILKFVPDEKGKWTSTLATNGKTIVYNPKWIVDFYQYAVRQNSPEVAKKYMETLVAHECGHVAALHPWRRFDREDKKWQLACDGVLNDILKSRGYLMPPDAFVYDGGRKMTADELYRMLRDNKVQGKSQSWGQALDPDEGPERPQDGGGDQEGDGEGNKYGPSAYAREQAENEAREATAQAAMRAQKEGKLPGSYEDLIKEGDLPQRDWRDVLRKFMGGGNQRDLTWSKPNRRFIANDMYLPGMTPHGPGEVVLAVDTSGSIDDRLLSKFLAEMRKINEDMQPDKIHVVCCDACVQWTQTFQPQEEIHAKALGRGGTAFSPVFRWVREQGIQPKALIYFTDLYCSDFGSADYPVTWVVWPGGSTAKPPFGDVLYMD